MNERDSGRSTAAIIGGAVLVALGAWLLFGRVLDYAPIWFARIARIGLAAIGPLALIGLGILVIIAADRGAFSEPRDLSGKRWMRSRGDRMVAGVLGGLGAYLGIDSTLLRLGYVLLTLITGLWLGVVVYIVAVVIVPEEPVEAGAAHHPPTAPPPPGSPSGPSTSA